MYRYVINNINGTNPIPLKSTGLTLMLPTIFIAAMRFCGSATMSVCCKIIHSRTCKTVTSRLILNTALTNY